MKANTLKFGLYSIPIYSIHEDFIGTNILGISKSFGIWQYKFFQKPDDPSKQETISVKIEKSKDPTKLEALIQSVVKFKILDEERIKPINVIEKH